MCAASPTRVDPAPITAAAALAQRATGRPQGHAAASTGRAVVVQSGARDAYQLALALAEAGLLEALVTDLFWPADRAWARGLARLLPRRLTTLLLQRSEPRLPSRRVHQLRWMGLRTLLLERFARFSQAARRRQMRAADAALGRAAGELARRRSATLISYSYYGFDAFGALGRPGLLFQLHPHPASMRRLLLHELAAHPDCASSLQQEWELALPEEDYQHLVRETEMASGFLTASSFTRATLIEHGASPERIRVVPYGVDLHRFHPGSPRSRPSSGPLQLLFVGRINQRKGIKYLLEALRRFRSDEVELTVCGRAVDALELFRPFAGQVRLRPSVSAEELAAAYQSADLFVFPSVAEGFGQVLLEALASGLPVLATTRTAAPDLITEGEEGFVIEPGDSEAVAVRIAWALAHRADLDAMRPRARRCAERFTWERFRAGVVDAVRSLTAASAVPAQPSRGGMAQESGGGARHA